MALESPYYGSRRPPWQEGSKLVRVSDLLTLGRTTIEESLYLLAWAQRQEYQRLGAVLKQAVTFVTHLYHTESAEAKWLRTARTASTMLALPIQFCRSKTPHCGSV